MLAMLEGHPRRPGHFNPDLLFEIRTLLEGIFAELQNFTDPANNRTDPDILAFQIPGGMLSNFRVQLKDLNMSDRISEVMREIPVVREALGWIPLVTPTSQIVGTQAMLNVKFGRWKNIAPAAMDIALGKFGRTPGPVDPGLLALAPPGQSPAATDRTVVALPPGMPALREKVAAAGLPVTDEACVLFAMFPQQTTAWFRGERPAPPTATQPAAPAPPAAPAAPAAPAGAGVRRMRISIGGISREALVETVP
jgi:oxaloacetate decarboxylase alpha subunit/pyruvate carboxylase subunit B